MRQRRQLAAVPGAFCVLRSALLVGLIAAATCQQSAGAADFETIDYPVPPRSVSVDRPAWAAQSVSVDGPVIWAVALLSPGVQSWHDRLVEGSKQAQARLFTVAEDAVSRHSSGQTPAFRERLLEQARDRLKLLVDREAFIRVETVERPDAVWMRLGYPSSEVVKAIGFPLPGAAPLPELRRLPSPAPAISVHSGWDYVWEATWLVGVVAATVLVTGVALAMGH